MTPLYVLFIGLVALVPIDARSSMVLLPDAREARPLRLDGSLIATAPPHLPGIGFVAETGEWVTADLPTDLSLGRDAGQTIDSADMLILSRILGVATAQEARDRLATCILSKEACPPLISRVEILGGTLEAGNLVLDRDLADPRRLVFTREPGEERLGILEFEADRRKEEGRDAPRASTSAIVVRLEVDEPELVLDGNPVRLGTLPERVCRKLVPDGRGPCHFVRIHNIPQVYFGPPKKSKVRDVDFHFGHFFGLLDDPGNARLRLPFVLEVDGGERFREQPSSRCPNLLIE